MKIAMVGSGYVGLMSGACLADVGHDVACIDKAPVLVDPRNVYQPGDMRQMGFTSTSVGRS